MNQIDLKYYLLNPITYIKELTHPNKMRKNYYSIFILLCHYSKNIINFKFKYDFILIISL